VIKCVPMAKVEVDKLASPPAFSGEVPSRVLPSKNCTVPVGTALPVGPVTIVANVTVCPRPEGFCDDVGVATLADALEFPLLISTLAVLESWFAITKSGTPSWLTSPTARATGMEAVRKDWAAPRLRGPPLEVLGKYHTAGGALRGAAAMAMSAKPSILKSALATAVTPPGMPDDDGA